MQRRTSSMLLLIATASLVLVLASVRSASTTAVTPKQTVACLAAIDRDAAIQAPDGSPSFTPVRSTPTLTWSRFRSKSVLEEKDVRAFQPVPLGPVNVPAPPAVSTSIERGPVFLVVVIPLRC